MSQPDVPPPSAPRDGLTRRSLVAAGVAGGLGVGVAAPAEASPGHAGTGPSGSTVVEFRGRIDQTGPAGEAFASYGYLTRMTHSQPADLFAGTPHNDTTALLTVFARGDLRARVLDVAVHSLDIVGTMTIYQRDQAGAHFDDPASFREGRVVGRFDVLLQDILAVYAAGQGLPTLTGDMVQTRARALSGPLQGLTFGRRGSRLRMFATGLGKLIDPVTLNAQLEIAGNWSAE